MLRERESTGVLTVTSAPTFAAKWLLQHLEGFSALYPDINVRLDARLEVVDLEREDVDVAVRMGDGQYPGMRVEQLFGELVVAVCHPKYLEGEHRLELPTDLRHHTLLHVDWGSKISGPLPDWTMWLTLAGVDTALAKRGPVFTVEGMAIAAAVRGSGIALASTYSVQEELASGALVIPFDQSLTPAASYWVVAPERTADQPKVKAFREWIMKTARETGLTGR